MPAGAIIGEICDELKPGATPTAARLPCETGSWDHPGAGAAMPGQIWEPDAKSGSIIVILLLCTSCVYVLLADFRLPMGAGRRRFRTSRRPFLVATSRERADRRTGR
jgi:hypothetical protein